MAAELRRGEEIRRGEGGRHQEEQRLGQTDLQQSPGADLEHAGGSGRVRLVDHCSPAPLCERSSELRWLKTV